MYRLKKQDKAKYLTILYTNLSKNNIILTLGKIIANGSICTIEKKRNLCKSACGVKCKSIKVEIMQETGRKGLGSNLHTCQAPQRSHSAVGQ